MRGGGCKYPATHKAVEYSFFLCVKNLLMKTLSHKPNSILYKTRQIFKHLLNFPGEKTIFFF